MAQVLMSITCVPHQSPTENLLNIETYKWEGTYGTSGRDLRYNSVGCETSEWEGLTLHISWETSKWKELTLQVGW